MTQNHLNLKIDKKNPPIKNEKKKTFTESNPKKTRKTKKKQGKQKKKKKKKKKLFPTNSFLLWNKMRAFLSSSFLSSSRFLSSSCFLSSSLLTRGLSGVNVLGIETSCDETGVAIVNGDKKVIASGLASQLTLHKESGGINPSVAQREHKKVIDELLFDVLKRYDNDPSSLSGVAVTIGPGLSPCLYVGVNKAIEVAKHFNLPFYGINHLEGHILAAHFSENVTEDDFPYLTLLASGGHTLILLVRGYGQYELLGGTMDDAVGEAYDKVSRMLALDKLDKKNKNFSGGYLIEKYARMGKSTDLRFKTALKGKGTRDLSFSGIKSAVARHIFSLSPPSVSSPQESSPPRVASYEIDESVGVETRANICFAFQKSVAKQLEDRIRLSLVYCQENDISVKKILFTGGVAQNTYIKKFLMRSNFYDLPIVSPPGFLCGDNGEMIAYAGVCKIQQGISPDEPVEHVKPQWSLDPNFANNFQFISPIPKAFSQGVKK